MGRSRDTVAHGSTSACLSQWRDQFEVVPRSWQLDPYRSSLRHVLVAIRSRFSTDFSSMATGTTGHVTPERISSEAFDQSQ